MVAGDGPSLIGRDWLGELIPDLAILNSSADDNLQSLLRKYSELFNEELGLVKGLTVKLQVDTSVLQLNQELFHMLCDQGWKKNWLGWQEKAYWSTLGMGSACDSS